MERRDLERACADVDVEDAADSFVLLAEILDIEPRERFALGVDLDVPFVLVRVEVERVTRPPPVLEVDGSDEILV